MNSCSVEITATTLSPLYTGEVREDERRASKIAAPIRKTATGRVIVQFKGALRSALEKLLPEAGVNVCSTGKSKARPCGACAVCSMFGSMGRKGRLTVDFLLSDDDHRQIVRKSSHIRLDRERNSVTDTYSAEEVIEGVIFRAKIWINSEQPSDLEYLQKALDRIERDGIGGWGNKGYGRVKFGVEHTKC